MVHGYSGAGWVGFVSLSALLTVLLAFIFYLIGLYSRIPGPTSLIVSRGVPPRPSWPPYLGRVRSRRPAVVVDQQDFFPTRIETLLISFRSLPSLFCHSPCDCHSPIGCVRSSDNLVFFRRFELFHFFSSPAFWYLFYHFYARFCSMSSFMTVIVDTGCRLAFQPPFVLQEWCCILYSIVVLSLRLYLYVYRRVCQCVYRSVCGCTSTCASMHTSMRTSMCANACADLYWCVHWHTFCHVYQHVDHHSCRPAYQFGHECVYQRLYRYVYKCHA